MDNNHLRTLIQGASGRICPVDAPCVASGRNWALFMCMGLDNWVLIVLREPKGVLMIAICAGYLNMHLALKSLLVSISSSY